MMSVEEVADLFEAGCSEAIGFVDDEQFGEAARAGLGLDVGVDRAVFVEVDREGDLLGRGGKPAAHFSDRCGDCRGEEGGPRFEDARWDGAEVAGEDGLPSLAAVGGREQIETFRVRWASWDEFGRAPPVGGHLARFGVLPLVVLGDGEPLHDPVKLLHGGVIGVSFVPCGMCPGRWGSSSVVTLP